VKHNLDELRMVIAGGFDGGDIVFGDMAVRANDFDRETHSSIRLEIVRGAVTVSGDFGVVELGKILPEIGMGRKAIVATVDLSNGERDALAGLSGQGAFVQCAGQAEKLSSAAGLFEIKRNMFGTVPSCFLTPSSKDREALGAASIVAGVGMRDMGYPFEVLVGLACERNLAPSRNPKKTL
jgi:hypothetical protein